MNLAEFLLARIAEDERHARAAADRIPLIYDADLLREKGLGIAQAGHIARWDPTRVLAECEAKRQVVEHEAPGPRSHGDSPIQWEYVPPVLALLALPYASHPDYQARWAPTVAV